MMKDPNTAIYADVYGSTEIPQESWSKGEKQESKCRDPFFAVLLYANVAAIIGVAISLAPEGIEKVVSIAKEAETLAANVTNTTNLTLAEEVYFDLATPTPAPTSALANDDDNDDPSFMLYIYAMVATGVISMVLSGLMLLAMMRFPTFIIKAAIYFMLFTSLLTVILSVFSGFLVATISSIVVFVIVLYYAYAGWRKIPYTSTTLLTGTTAVRDNCGVTCLSFLVVVLAFGWSLLWLLAFLGYSLIHTECVAQYDPQTASNQLVCYSNGAGFIYFLLALSYFFTHQVLQNTIHVIVAGIVGTWWFSPDAAHSCCSTAIYDSTIRALTTSFGSICFGSLIVAIIQALRELAEGSRRNGGGDVLACLAACILGCLQSIVEYFNRWAFVYVGLYGYGYLEAGKNVMTLFRNRGWTVFLTDYFIYRALALISLVVGLVSGGCAVLIVASAKGFAIGFWPLLISFLLGLIMGTALCSIFMSTVASAINSVIVLFAEAPAEFQQNYPELSDKMRAAWSEAYPGHSF